MGEDKTIKVEKTLTVRYNILSDVLVSPARLEILNRLFESPYGLTSHELAHQLSEQTDIQDHLDVLLEENIVEEKNGKYFLSKKGLDFYYSLGKAAMKVKEEGLLSRDPNRQNL